MAVKKPLLEDIWNRKRVSFTVGGGLSIGYAVVFAYVSCARILCIVALFMQAAVYTAVHRGDVLCGAYFAKIVFLCGCLDRKTG